jgi:hypothetical protein
MLMWHDPNLSGARLSGNTWYNQEKQGCDALVATAVLNAFSAGTRGRARSALRLHRPLGHPSSVAMSQEKPSLVDRFISIPIKFYANKKEDDLVASKGA